MYHLYYHLKFSSSNEIQKQKELSSSNIEELIKEGEALANLPRKLQERTDEFLSACLFEIALEIENKAVRLYDFVKRITIENDNGEVIREISIPSLRTS